MRLVRNLKITTLVASIFFSAPALADRPEPYVLLDDLSLLSLTVEYEDSLTVVVEGMPQCIQQDHITINSNSITTGES